MATLHLILLLWKARAKQSHPFRFYEELVLKFASQRPLHVSLARAGTMSSVGHQSHLSLRLKAAVILWSSSSSRLLRYN